MKNGHLLIGLGLSAAVGAALGYFLASDKKDKLVEDLRHTLSDMRVGMKDMCSRVKEKAEEAREEFAEHVEKTMHPSGNASEQ